MIGAHPNQTRRAVTALGPVRRDLLELPAEAMAITPGQNLRGADLQGAYLPEAMLQGAILCSAELQGAELPGADLRDSNLANARLESADLRGAQLQRADLRGASLAGTRLEGALYDRRTLWPDGFDAARAGATLVETVWGR